MAFIDQQRVEGYAVESICRVLREQGCQVAARTYRAWTRPRISQRLLSDAEVANAVFEIVWRHEDLPDQTRRRVMNPEGLYGRRKMLVAVRNHTGQRVSFGSVDRAMRGFGLQGVRRDKGIRTTIPAKDGVRAGDLLNRDFTASAPNRCWVTDPNSFYNGNGGTDSTLQVIGTLEPHGNVPAHVHVAADLSFSDGLTVTCVESPDKKRRGTVFNGDTGTHSIEVECPRVDSQPTGVLVRSVSAS